MRDRRAELISKAPQAAQMLSLSTSSRPYTRPTPRCSSAPVTNSYQEPSKRHTEDILLNHETRNHDRCSVSSLHRYPIPQQQIIHQAHSQVLLCTSSKEFCRASPRRMHELLECILQDKKCLRHKGQKHARQKHVGCLSKWAGKCRASSSRQIVSDMQIFLCTIDSIMPVCSHYSIIIKEHRVQGRQERIT